MTPAEGDTDSERDRSHTSLDVQDGFAVLTLNRPEVRNALTDPEMLWEIVDVFDHPPAPVLVVTGAGSAFSAGGNVKEMAAGAGMFAGTVGEVAENYRSTIQRLTRAVAHTEAVTIAAVNGPAVGAGVQLALAADLRVVAPGAVFAVPVVKVGLALDNWTIKRLANVVGGGHARTVLMTARPVGAEEAARIGLANEIGDLEAAMELAAEVAGFAPLTLQHIKTVINDDDARLLPRDEHTALQQRAWQSEDMAEARAAREEKRPPVFRGR